MFDGSGKPVGERNVDQSVNFGATRNTYSAHSKFSENTQAEKVVDRTGKPDERDSSSAQIRTLLEEQRQMIVAEYREKVGHHELQAAHAEEERRLLREELWRQKLEFREAHQQSLTEMEELRKFQSSTFDTIARRKLIEDQNTILELFKEVELVESVDELRTSSSIRGISMPNFEVLDARIASALNRIIHYTQFKRKVSLEEQKAQKEDRFLRGRQIAYLIHEQFRVTGSHDSVENYADLFTISLRNDDIQEFDSKWDGLLLSMTKNPT